MASSLADPRDRWSKPSCRQSCRAVSHHCLFPHSSMKPFYMSFPFWKKKKCLPGLGDATENKSDHTVKYTTAAGTVMNSCFVWDGRGGSTESAWRKPY